MAKQSSEFILSSLRNRILLAVAALVVFNSIFGLLSYLAVSFAVSEPIYAVVMAVAAMTAATAAFGWWLSNEILRPVEAVALLARSLERSPSASLPRTTGASETDEILGSLHRNSRQLQNLIGLMDDVASGRTDAAMAPLPNPDRLSVSFQKLVSKVVESIKAKQQLDALQSSVNRLKNDAAAVRAGQLSVEFRGDLWQVGEIADAFKFVLGNFSELVRHVSSASIAARDSAEEARKMVRTVIDAENGQTERLKKAASVLSESPERFGDLAERLDASIEDIYKCLKPTDASPARQSETIDRLRTAIRESRKQLELLRDRTSLIPNAARKSEEIARRSNIIALNIAVQSVNDGHGRDLGDEVASLSIRSEAVHKEVLAINETLASDLANLEASLAAAAADIAQVTSDTAKYVDSLAEFEKHVVRIDTIRTDFKRCAGEHMIESEAVVKSLTSSFNGVDCPSQLRQSEQNLESILNSAEVLKEAVTHFRSSLADHTSDRSISPASAEAASPVEPA